MQFRCHRGGVYYTPENTMPAFQEALRAGYDQIETDPQFTRDAATLTGAKLSVLSVWLT